MRPADRAWLTLGASVAVWDLACPRGEMLSEASARYATVRPLLWHGTIIYIAGHLMHVWPERVDFLSRAGAGLRAVTRGL